MNQAAVALHPARGPAESKEPQDKEIDERLSITSLLDGTSTGSTIAVDVLAGLQATPKTLPPKYFYDERGAQLFDAICDTDEYYPTRTEQALLERVAGEIVQEAEPTELVELGSGAARKTRVLLDELTDAVDEARYTPVDISEEMLRESAEALLRDYPSLSVHGVVADYDHHLHLLPEGKRRLIAFLGSTLGNFKHTEAIEFVSSVASGMQDGDRLILGLDLVKSPAVLHAAYNDSDGVTAEFNRNVLNVLNRELDAEFEPDDFEHVAQYQHERQQIEMSLRARRSHSVRIGQLGQAFEFAAGERVRTEISRKFTRDSAESILNASGLEMSNWYVSEDQYFALAVAASA
ncbi:MAG: L-histidine N(alpha)-methyltransferase [Myxococcota bacterium]